MYSANPFATSALEGGQCSGTTDLDHYKQAYKFLHLLHSHFGYRTTTIRLKPYTHRGLQIFHPWIETAFPLLTFWRRTFFQILAHPIFKM